MLTPYYTDEQVTLYSGDCLDVLALLPDSSIDSCVCDPPYGLEFMGKAWDSFKATGHFVGGGANKPAGGEYARAAGRDRKGFDGLTPAPRFEAGVPFQSWCQQWATECLRVLKPGGHMLAFGGTRTWHRLACAVEDAGFEIRDSIAWLYGSGFPKSLDVSKAIDKRPGVNAHKLFAADIANYRQLLGLSRADVSEQVLGTRSGACWNWEHHQFPEAKWWPKLKAVLHMDDYWDSVIAEADREYVGEGTNAARRPKPGAGATIHMPAGDPITAPATDAAKQWQGWGTALKPAFEPVVVARKPLAGTVAANVQAWGTGALNIDGCRVHADDAPEGRVRHGGGIPGNGSSYELPDVRPESPAGRWPANVVLDDAAAAELDRMSGTLTSGSRKAGEHVLMGYMGADSAPMPAVDGDSGGASRFFPTFRYTAKAATAERPTADGVAHPTVKPLELMRWLVRLVTPPGGTVLDPFAGSGTTGEAAIHEHKKAVLIEREPSYLPLIVARLSKPMEVGFDFGEVG